MSKIRVAIVGYGNVGNKVLEVLQSSADFEIVGVVRRNVENLPAELLPYKVTDSISKLEKVDVAILSAPSRSVEKYAIECLMLGINTVDSYDIHSSIVDLRRTLDKTAKENSAVSVISAGWDPGSNSIVRTLFEAMTPHGITYTNFGPGMSMGHTVAVKAIKGVKNALSLTMPVGGGVHRRMVYVELEEGVSFASVESEIKSDSYFVNDETHVFQVADVELLKDMGHGVKMERKGASGKTQNQLFSFDMRINNPALTAQLLVCAARATMKQQPGAYTLIEIPVVNFLPGDREGWIKKLV